MDDFLVKKITARWDSDISSLKLISKGINLVYRVEVAGRAKILKISSPPPFITSTCIPIVFNFLLFQKLAQRRIEMIAPHKRNRSRPARW